MRASNSNHKASACGVAPSGEGLNGRRSRALDMKAQSLIQVKRPADVIGFTERIADEGNGGMPAIHTAGDRHQANGLPDEVVPDEVPGLDTEASPATDVTERLLATNLALGRRVDQLTAALRYKDLLLRERNHRIKNDLQTASSLLILQATKESNPAAASKLLDGASRIQSLGAIYDGLRENEGSNQIEMSAYLADLGRRLEAFHSFDKKTIRLRVDAAPLILPARIAVPLGLVVNELVTNSCKHAFAPGQPGDIRVALRQDDQLILTVADNGRGLPADFPDRRDASFGISLIQGILEHLGGTLEVMTGEDGTCWTAFVPKPALGLSTRPHDGRGHHQVVKNEPRSC